MDFTDKNSSYFSSHDFTSAYAADYGMGSAEALPVPLTMQQYFGPVFVNPAEMSSLDGIHPSIVVVATELQKITKRLMSVGEVMLSVSLLAHKSVEVVIDSPGGVSHQVIVDLGSATWKEVLLPTVLEIRLTRAG